MDNKKRVSFAIFSDEEVSSDEEKKNMSIDDTKLKKFDNIKHQLYQVHPDKYADIPYNTKICYITNQGNIVFDKFYKNADQKYMRIGFSKDNSPTKKKNYKIDMPIIMKLYTYGLVIEGGSNRDPNLKNTILVKKEEWDDMQSGTVVSYAKKDDQKFVYKAKFNCRIETSNGKIKYSLTNQTGFNYVANPEKIDKIYRHLLPIDFTLLQILESINKLKNDVSEINKKIAKMEN